MDSSEPTFYTIPKRFGYTPYTPRKTGYTISKKTEKTGYTVSKKTGYMISKKKTIKTIKTVKASNSKKITKASSNKKNNKKDQDDQKKKKNLNQSTPGYQILKLPAVVYPSTVSRTIHLANDRICTTPLNAVATDCSLEMVYARLHRNQEKMMLESGKIARMQWDQPIPGKVQARIGDLFGFVLTAGDFDKIEIFEIVGLADKNARRWYWNEDIPKQSDKSVVYLSEYIGWVSSTDYVNTVNAMGGKKVPSVVQGNKNFGKMYSQNGTQVYPWSPEIVVNVP